MPESASPPTTVPDWLPGRLIDTRGRKKVVLASGMVSRSGEALRQLDGFARYLKNNFGFVDGDFLEVSYHSERETSGWRPAPYDSRHCEASLGEGALQTAISLSWYRGLLPDDTEYHLIGYSLGGVLLFEAVGGLLDTDAARWAGRLRSLTTLSAPLFGSDLGIEGDLLAALGFDVLLPPGEAVSELVRRGGSVAHRQAVEGQARRLRDHGVQLLTLADVRDVVVTPDDAVIAPPGERDHFVLDGPRVPAAEPGRNPLGHGPVLWNTLAWVRMAKLIGQQDRRAP
jgi:hypothetical protein